MSAPGGAPLTVGERIFSRLGRGIAKHPWYPILFWVALLLVALPFLSQVNSVTANSTSTLPTTAPSARADAEMARLFPNTTVGSASILVLTGTDITGPTGRDSVLSVAAAIPNDPKMEFVGNVSTFFSAYQDYLTGMTQLSAGTIQAAVNTPPGILGSTNLSAQLIWGPPALFFQQWKALVDAHAGTSPAGWVYPAYNATRQGLGADRTEQLVLNAFYAQFNNSSVAPSLCRTSGVTPVCTDGAARLGLASLLPQLATSPAALSLARAVLAGLATENFTQPAAQRLVATEVLGQAVGLPTSWVGRVWAQFPTGVAPLAQVTQWTHGLVANWTPSNEPLPAPFALRSQFVDPSNTATLVYVTFTKIDSYVDSKGETPIFDDVRELDVLVPVTLARTDPGRTLSYQQTGGAALDLTQNDDLSASLALVLPLTVLVLVLITMLYFRAPLAPGVTFGGLGIAITLGLGGIVLIGKLITHVDPTALTLENTFVLGVGTDYSIFMLARYREELHKGQPSHDAIVTAVTWAGQSVATSGATAILATLALAFSGVALLSQWGMVLSLAVLLTVLVSLTLVPALLVLLGPRVFWPSTGLRLAAEGAKVRDRVAHERTYFYRVGRLTQKRPRTVVAITLIASIPLLYLALHVPLSYDFYQQLPPGQSSTDGLTTLADHFGPGFAFPFTVLATFATPLLVGNQTNGAEFSQLAQMTSLVENTSGVASVASPVGIGGAPLAAWLTYGNSSPGTQAQLQGILAGFLGNDHRTVQVTVTSSAPGLSVASVTLLGNVKSELHGYAASHGAVTGLAFGGGASVTNDLQQQTALATERMAIAVSIGLFIVLFAVLRSWLIPILAVATIGISIGWAWGVTDLAMHLLLGYPLFFFVPTILFILILGLGIDYNIFLLTRVREERLKGRPASEAVVHAVGSTGGIISAAAVILASAFAILTTGSFILLKTLGFAVATAVVLDAMVVRTYLVPATLQLLGERVWTLFGRRTVPPGEPVTPP